MSRNESVKWIGVVGRMLLAYVFVFSQTALAGQNPQTQNVKNRADSSQKTAQTIPASQSSSATTAKTKAEEVENEPSETAEAKQKPLGDASHEGIKVHGHWTIEVRNPDGSVATHREFENSLVGPGTLSLFLARQYSVGTWQINLVGLPDVCLTSGQPVQCIITEPNVPPQAGSVFTNLVVTAPLTFHLQGTATAQASGQIVAVTTGVFLCNASNPVSTPCYGNSPGFLGFNGVTNANLGSSASPVINVAAGQTIAVTVVISFS
jgi:hypothetical protein